ncbi:extracellular solute-binding protein [Bradyrhizobium sp. 143]|uniref:extracellular solute-binding protein n=1 Tax=Bradyrhizobium sp. 143 TaxID=2782619 RepID=UPI002097C5A6|nr:extracellular solute-binding protein [Bradyrhizobium sp. 143]
MIEAFEKANPSIKIKVVVDPAGANGIRAARTKSGSPDVIRVSNFQLAEFAATGSILPLDELVVRDKIDANDADSTRADQGQRQTVRTAAGLPDSDPDLSQEPLRRCSGDDTAAYL